MVKPIEDRVMRNILIQISDAEHLRLRLAAKVKGEPMRAFSRRVLLAEIENALKVSTVDHK